MDIAEEQSGDACIVVLKGRLDGTSSAAFTDRIGALIGNRQSRLLFDFAAVTLVTSAGLRALLLVAKRMKAEGGVFALCGVPPAVREVFDISGFSPLLNIHGSRSDGLAAVGG